MHGGVGGEGAVGPLPIPIHVRLSTAHIKLGLGITTNLTLF